MKLLFTNEWLRKRIETEPDECCEAGWDMTETIFTCRKCEANYEAGHLPQPVTECPICGWGKKVDAPKEREMPTRILRHRWRAP